MRLLQAGPGPGRWLDIWEPGVRMGGERGGGRVHVAGSLGVSLGRVRQARIRVRTGIRVRGPVSERPPERMGAGVPSSGVGGPAGVQVRGGAGVAAAARAPISRGRAAGWPH